MMKLVTGLGSLEDFLPLAEAGTDEFFVGYVPFWYYEKYGNLLPANRREVFFYHVQFTTLEDMRILKQLSLLYEKPVSVTFNALFYTMEQMHDIYGIMCELLRIGFDQFIISDVGLLLFLSKKGLKAKIEISGEFGEMNSQTISFLQERFADSPGLTRVIFQRKTSYEAMKHMIIPESMEREAFLMNENCQFSGGYCNSMHCDEMVHLCLMPYEVLPVDGRNHLTEQVNEIGNQGESDINNTGSDIRNDNQVWNRGNDLGQVGIDKGNDNQVWNREHDLEQIGIDKGNDDLVWNREHDLEQIGIDKGNDNQVWNRGNDLEQIGIDKGNDNLVWNEEGYDSSDNEMQDVCGLSGCGLCNLWKYREAKITHLKIVGRGLSADVVEKDVRAARRALEILNTATSEEGYQREMMSVVFPKGCSKNCYFVD